VRQYFIERRRRKVIVANNPKVIFAGEVAQIAGVISAVAGVVLSLHHWPAAAALIGGAAAFFVGKKLRAT
jgi:hypothetical protein